MFLLFLLKTAGGDISSLFWVFFLELSLVGFKLSKSSISCLFALLEFELPKLFELNLLFFFSSISQSGVSLFNLLL